MYSDYQTAFDSISVPRTAEDGDVVSTELRRDRRANRANHSTDDCKIFHILYWSLVNSISVKTMCREDTAETNTNVVLAGVCTKQWSPAPEIGMAEDPMDIAPPPSVNTPFPSGSQQHGLEVR
jgi:hypothetical protein